VRVAITTSLSSCCLAASSSRVCGKGGGDAKVAVGIEDYIHERLEDEGGSLVDLWSEKKKRRAPRRKSTG
jgi:hypothetical protein